MPERIAQDERLTPAADDRSRWLGLVALTIGVAMIIVDATIVNVAIPSIIRDLRIGITQAEWANSIYSLVFAALLISVGRVGDVTGRRRVFICGLLVFLGASLITALAPSGTVLLAGRFLQGVGAALILPATLSIVNATFRGRERAIAFGIWGSVIGGMAALGPLAGGWFVTNLSWRWAFYVNLPIGALALAGTLLFVGESRDPGARPGFDPPGVALSTIGFLGVVFGLIEGQTYGWWTAQRGFLGLSPGGLSVIPFAFALGVLSLAGFVLVERRRALAGRPVLVDFSLYPDPDLPLRQRRGPDRRARRARARLRDPALPAVGARPLGLRHRDRAGRPRRRSVPRGRAGRAAHPHHRAAPGRAARSRDRGRRHRRRRPHLLRRPPRLAVLPAALPLRDRRRLRDRAADEPHPRRRAASPVRRGIGDPEHLEAGRLRARDRDPRHRAHDRARLRHPRPPRSSPVDPASTARRDHSRRRAERRSSATRLRRTPQLQPAVAPVEEAFVASARRAAFIAAAFVLVGLAAAFQLRPSRQDEPEPRPT